MTYLSFNVNSLRSIVQKMDLAKELKKYDFDVLGLQETKLSSQAEEDFPLPIRGYALYQTVSKARKGYSGVAVLTRVEPLSVHYGLAGGKYDDEGRAVTLEFDDSYFVCLYVPNSGEELKRLPFRLDFQRDLEAYLSDLQRKKPVVVTGDLNVAKEEIDLKNPSSNHHNAGFTDQEREAMRRLLKDCGLVDSFRLLHPDEVKYSWWSYRFHAREKNAGWRIDYFLVSSSLAKRVEKAEILNEVMGSDHCPVLLTIA